MTHQAVNYLVAAAGERAGLVGLHPHYLRHSCGFALADRGHELRLIQDYLGHRDSRHTVHYTRTAERRFEGSRKAGAVHLPAGHDGADGRCHWGGYTYRAVRDYVSVVRTRNGQAVTGKALPSTFVVPGDVINVFERLF